MSRSRPGGSCGCFGKGGFGSLLRGSSMRGFMRGLRESAGDRCWMPRAATRFGPAPMGGLRGRLDAREGVVDRRRIVRTHEPCHLRPVAQEYERGPELHAIRAAEGASAAVGDAHVAHAR